jgi:hypothetical protein
MGVWGISISKALGVSIADRPKAKIRGRKIKGCYLSNCDGIELDLFGLTFILEP